MSVGEGLIDQCTEAAARARLAEPMPEGTPRLEYDRLLEAQQVELHKWLEPTVRAVLEVVARRCDELANDVVRLSTPRTFIADDAVDRTLRAFAAELRGSL